MNISTQGMTLLMEREGVRNHAYRDSVGVWTIGVGHTGPEVHEGLVWTDEMVRQAFAKDLERFEAAVNAVPMALEQFEFDALVSFAFNIGVAGFNGSTLRKCLAQGDREGAANQFDRWHIPAEITSRRNGEREQFKGAAFVARIEGAMA